MIHIFKAPYRLSGKHIIQKFIFNMKYNLGIAKEGKDFTIVRK